MRNSKKKLKGMFEKIGDVMGLRDNRPEDDKNDINDSSEKLFIDFTNTPDLIGYVDDEEFEAMENASAQDDFYKLSEDEQRIVSSYVDELVDHFIRHKNEDFARSAADTDDALEEEENRKQVAKAKEAIMQKVDNQLEIKKVPIRYRNIVKHMFESFKWGYFILEPLLADPEISDIKLYDYDKIDVKRLGKRYWSDIKFVNRKAYINFVNMILTRNGQGQSNNNAVAKFVDTASNPLFRLRFSVLTKYVVDQKYALMHIRLVPKIKRSLDVLENKYDMFPYGTKNYLLKRLAAGDGMLYTGKNGSGKTTVVNGLLDHIDEQKSVMIIEDNQELFSDVHKRIMYTHSVESRTDGKITYGLSDLAEEALLCDIDVEIVGEVKNDSAKGLMKAAYVGVQCISTSHGQSAIDGYYKLADYVKQATGYELSDCLRFLVGLKTLVFMKDYKVNQIVRVNGWNSAKLEPDFEVLFDMEKGGWIKNETY